MRPFVVFLMEMLVLSTACPTAIPDDGTLIWKWQASEVTHSGNGAHPYSISENTIASGNQTVLSEPNTRWTGHFGIYTEGGTCNSLQIKDGTGTSLLWKELTMPQGEVWKVSVQTKNSQSGSFMGLVNAQAVLFGCAAMNKDLAALVRKYRMSPTKYDATMGPDASDTWVTLTAYVKMEYAQINDIIAVALGTGGRKSYEVSEVRVEKVDNSICNTQTCKVFPDCSEYSASGTSASAPKEYRPHTFTTTCLDTAIYPELKTTSKPLSSPGGGRSPIVFGAVKTGDALNFLTSSIAQIILNEAVGVQTRWVNSREDTDVVVSHLAGLNYTMTGASNMDLAAGLPAPVNQSWLDVSSDTQMPLTMVVLPVAPTVLEKGYDRIPAAHRGSFASLGTMEVNMYSSLWVTNGAFNQASLDGRYLDTWTTYNRNNGTSWPYKTYFKEPFMFAKKTGFNPDPAFTCKATGPFAQEMKKRGYRCDAFVGTWWASPAAVNFTMTRGKEHQEFHCAPLIWDPQQGRQLTEEMALPLFQYTLDVIEGSAMPVCISKFVEVYRDAQQQGNNFLAWVDYPNFADTTYETLVGLPAKYIPFRTSFLKAAWAGLQTLSQQSFTFLQRYDVSSSNMDTMLANVRKAQKDKPTESDATRNYREACRWVRDNVDRWKPMIQVVCPAGFVNSKEDQGVCVACDAGEYNPIGGMGRSCEACKPGTSSARTGTATCESCAPGYAQQSSGATACEACTLGKYQSKGGMETCTACGLDGATTLTLGSTDASACTCGPGTFQRPTVGCAPCEKGLSCPGGTNAPTQLLGYYGEVLDQSMAIDVFSCAEEEDCPQGPLQGCKTERYGRSCAKWDADTCSAGFSILAAILFIIALYVVYLAMTSKNYARVSPTTMLGGNLTVAAVAMQSVSVYFQFMEIIPPDLEWLVDFADIFMFKWQKLFPACSIGQDFAARFAMSIFPPLAIVCAYIVLFVITNGLNKVVKQVPATTIDNSINAAGTLIQTIYVMQCKDAASFFTRKENPTGKDTLQEFQDVVFASNEHFAAGPIFIDIYLFLVYVIGVYTLLIYIVCVARGKIQDNRFRAKWRFVIGRWRPGALYWGLLMLGRNFCIAMIPIVVSGKFSFRVMLFVMAITIHALGEGFVLPWNSFANTFSEIATSCLLIALSTIGLTFASNVSNDEKVFAAVWMHIFCALIWCLFIGTVVYAFVYFKRAPIRAAANREKGNDLIEKCASASEMANASVADKKQWDAMLGDCSDYDKYILDKAVQLFEDLSVGDEFRKRWTRRLSAVKLDPATQDKAPAKQVSKEAADPIDVEV